MAELLLFVKTYTKPMIEDGDIVVALNDKEILRRHTEWICNLKHQAKNSHGLNPHGCLAEVHLQNVMQYKFERIDTYTLKRTEIKSGIFNLYEPIFVNGQYRGSWWGNEHIFVDTYIKRHPSKIFGATGKEVWYGGNTNTTQDALDTIWLDIDAKTGKKKENHLEHNWGKMEIKHFLPIMVDDFSDELRHELPSPVYDESDPENPVLIMKHKCKVDYRNEFQLSASELVDIDNMNKDNKKYKDKQNNKFKIKDIVFDKVKKEKIK